MHSLFRPGMALLNSLSYPRKFLLITVLFLAPLILAIVLLFSETQPQIQFTRQELAGTIYLRPLRQLLEQVLLDRVLAVRVIQGDSNAQTELRLSRERIAEYLNTLQQVDSTTGQMFEGTSTVGELIAQWETTAVLPLESDPAPVITQYDQVIAAIHQLISLVGDRSNLILDPELAAYYLMDTILLKLPEQADLLARSQLAGLIHVRNDMQQDELLLISGLLEESSADLRQGLGVAFLTDPEIEQQLSGPAHRHVGATDRLILLIERSHTSDQTAMASTDIAQASAGAFETTFELWDQTVLQLDHRLQARLTRLQQKNGLAVGVALLLLVGVLYLLASFYLTVMQTVASLAKASQEMAAGERTATIALQGHDELSQVVQSFNTVATALVAASAAQQASEAARLRLQEQMIASQKELLSQLSAPMIPIAEGVGVIPLIGTLDAARVGHVTTTIAQGVPNQRLKYVILDMTGVPALDGEATEALGQVAATARLLGAQLVVSGISPQVAQILADHRLAFNGLPIYQSLQNSIEVVMQDIGR